MCDDYLRIFPGSAENAPGGWIRVMSLTDWETLRSTGLSGYANEASGFVFGNTRVRLIKDSG